MANWIRTRELIGLEDISRGVSTFNRTTSTGGSQVMSQISVTGTIAYAASFSGVDAFAKIQAAHDALPSTGGSIVTDFTGSNTVTTTLTITKPCTIQGLSKRGTKFYFTPTSGDAITVNVPFSAGGTADSVVLSDFFLLGPGSGIGNGIVIKSGICSHVENVMVNDFGNDGVVVDTSGGATENSNIIQLSRVESYGNGRHGFYLTPTGANSNLITFVTCSASTNGGDGFKIESQWNILLGTNSDDNTGYGYNFASTATDNYGVVYAEQNTAGDINFTSGCLRNTIHSLRGAASVSGDITTGGNAYTENSGSGYGWREFPITSIKAASTMGIYNRSDANLNVDVQPSTAAGSERAGIFRFKNKAGTVQWHVGRTSGDIFEVVDDVNTKTRLSFAKADVSYFNSGGTAANQLNVLAGSGTGGTQFGDGAGAAVASVNSAGLGSFSQLQVNGAGRVVSGSASTRNAVRTEYPSVSIGSVYLSTAGKAYLKVANAAADADWERVTTSAAD